MSAQNVQSFFDAVERSPELQRQVGPIQGSDRPENLKRFIDIAGKAGYAFTEQELVATVKTRAEQRMQSGVQLSETDLETIAGGTACTWTCLITHITI
jgi:predicted ribosomally synthesized peptide with nif11-like leader